MPTDPFEVSSWAVDWLRIEVLPKKKSCFLNIKVSIAISPQPTSEEHQIDA